MIGTLDILNVADGEMKITFNSDDPAEAIRAKRIITDMIRRGYALLVEVDGKTQRATGFDAARGEYIIADLDPLQAEEADVQEEQTKGPGGRRRRISMTSTRATAVAPSAGG